MKELKIIAKEPDSIRVQTPCGLKLWIDVYWDGEEMHTQWNKYIFHKSDPNDMAIKAYQENTDNFMECSSLAIEHYEQKTMKNA